MIPRQVQLSEEQEWLHEKPKAKNAKSKDISKCIPVPIKDDFNTVVYVDKKEEVEEAKQRYSNLINGGTWKV